MFKISAQGSRRKFLKDAFDQRMGDLMCAIENGKIVETVKDIGPVPIAL